VDYGVDFLGGADFCYGGVQVFCGLYFYNFAKVGGLVGFAFDVDYVKGMGLRVKPAMTAFGDAMTALGGGMTGRESFGDF